MLIVLQRSSCCLLQRTRQTENQKQLLRERFLCLGVAIASQLQQLGHPTELFDPKTGYPVFSQAGSLWLDDVAVVKACLGYPINRTQGCGVLIHPEWGSAVYPSILLSTATPEIVKPLIDMVVGEDKVISENKTSDLALQLRTSQNKCTM